MGKIPEFWNYGKPSRSLSWFVCAKIRGVIAYRRAAESNPFLSFFPPWLPLWGSCHEVTERVKTPFPPLLGTSPTGRGKGTDCHTSVATLVRNDMLYPEALGKTEGL